MDSPTTFGKYFLTEKLATGGMGEIYHGKLLGPGGFEKQLVIKQIHPELARRPEFVALFVAEAKTMVSLSHGNIVPIYELGVVAGTYFIAMEYVEGPTLSELLRATRAKKRTLDPPFAAFIAAEILKGLEYAHRKAGGVVHRDLSPRNVMVSRDGEVKILDFGLAATLDAAAAGDSGARPAGSYPYMSPEQAARRPLDARTDLFSVGILLWEMLTGARLFSRESDDETLEAVRDAEIPTPSTRVEGIAPELEAICLRALQRDLAARWPSAGDFLAALGKYLYRVEPAITQTALSRLVAELCPDTPRANDGELASRPPVDDRLSAVGGPATRPMTRRPATNGDSDVRTFATRVGFDAIGDHVTTPALPPPSSEAPANEPPAPESPPPARDAPPPARESPAVDPAPRRSGRTAAIVAAAVVATAAGAAIAVRATGSDRRAPAAPNAPNVAPPVDAGPSLAAAIDAAPRASVDAGVASALRATPDAAPTRKPPVARGDVKISTPEVVWAQIFVDGVGYGNTPKQLSLPAGKHVLRVVCPPEQCPPDGDEETRTILVEANREQLIVIKF